jgi:hypothetical protein
MPENRQAEGVAQANNSGWPWRRLMTGFSAILALLFCGLFVLGVLRSIDPPSDPLYQPPSFIGYLVFALFLFGAIAALWRGDGRLLAAGWLTLIGRQLIDDWLLWRAYPEFLNVSIPWSDILLICAVFLGFGLALTGWPSRRIERMNENAK